MTLRLVILASLATLVSATAAPRTWRNADASKSFDGEFLAREGKKITVRQITGKEITFDMNFLHEDDQKWINLYHPTDTSVKTSAPVSSGVFDELNFGDTPQQVEDKLKKSQIVETSTGVTQKSTLFGGIATGGDYRTRQKIGDLYTYLYFTWDEKDGSLAEISLQTESLSSISYNDTIKDTWSQLIELLTALHGNPAKSAPFPSSNQIPADTIIGSHVWKLEKGGTAMLGISQSEQKYLVVVRFSKKTIEELQKFQIPTE
jgi:hypothetical protein